MNLNTVPFISIIIPVLNAEKYIGLCLGALLLQEYPPNKYEIIILDNGSRDDTVSLVTHYEVKLFIKTNCTVSALRNFGTEQAIGDLFAFIDVDCIAPANWLKEASQLLKSDSIGAVGCWYALPDNTTLFERTWDTLTSIRREITGPIDWIPSGDLIMRRELFDQIQGFDEFLITSEDIDICNRINKSGRYVHSSPKLAVKHLGNPKTLASFYLKEKWRGEGVVQNVFREFPKVELNKAFLFGFISLIFLFGILAGLVQLFIGADPNLFLLSSIGLFIIPLFQTVKLSIKRQKWIYSVPLFMLFITYGVARASSMLNLKVWKTYR